MAYPPSGIAWIINMSINSVNIMNSFDYASPFHFVFNNTSDGETNDFYC